MAAEAIEICEVGPRDGFQPIPTWIPTERKIALVEALLGAGLTRVETGAFVSPRHVPQMKDTGEVHAKVTRPPGARLSALIPNLRGAEAAFAADVADLVYVFSISESHNHANVRRDVAASLEDLTRVVERGADQPGFRLRVNLATVFDCPFEGRIAEDAVWRALETVAALGADLEFGLCDTTGRALPDHVEDVCAGAAERVAGDGISYAFHGHDTFGFGVANALAAYRAGVRVFDASIAGLGGCPFAPGATGNTATEDLVFTFANMGVETGVNLSTLLAVADDAATIPDGMTGGHIRLVPRERALVAA